MADITYRDVRALNELAVNNRFRVNFSGFQGAYLSEFNASKELLNRCLLDANPPGHQMQTLTATIHTHTFKQPTIPRQDDTFSLTFQELSDGFIMRFTDALINSVRNDINTNALEPIEDSRFLVTIWMYDRTGQIQIREWKMTDCFLDGAVASPQLRGDKQGQLVTFRLTFGFNKFETDNIVG